MPRDSLRTLPSFRLPLAVLLVSGIVALTLLAVINWPIGFAGPGMLLAVVQTVCAIAWLPPRSESSAILTLPLAITLWLSQFFVLWLWGGMAITLLVWLLIWDSWLFSSVSRLVAITAIYSATIASITSLRMNLSLASTAYIMCQVVLSFVLALMSIPAILILLAALSNRT